MQYISHCESPLGKLLLSADDLGLTGIWFEGQKYFPPSLKEPFEEKEVPVIKETKRWLTITFLEKIQILWFLCTFSARISRKWCGKSYAPFPMEKP